MQHFAKRMTKMADYRRPGSPASYFRRKRFTLYTNLLSSLEPPINILDVGGTPAFWQAMRFVEERETRVLVLNVDEIQSTHPKIISVVGDARDLSEFEDGEFDVVFSNSVIEHVGDYQDQRRMAIEVRRVGQRYLLQTPNRSFPVEPHFLFPLFQFLPLYARVFLLRHFDLGWFNRTPDEREARETVRSIRLLTKRELRSLFPEATIYKEKFIGLTKSFVVYDGWSVTRHQMRTRKS